MDSWSKEQIKVMKLGGNQQCNSFLQEHAGMDPISTPIREKYDNPVAQFYKDLLKCRLEGKPEPSLDDIPKYTSTINQDDAVTCDGTDDEFTSTSDENYNNSKPKVPTSVSSGIESLRPVVSRIFASIMNRSSSNVR
jgi:hypothetical protein